MLNLVKTLELYKERWFDEKEKVLITRNLPGDGIDLIRKDLIY